MKVYKFDIGDEVRVTEKAKLGMPNYIGKIGVIRQQIGYGSYDYELDFKDNSLGRFKEEELDGVVVNSKNELNDNYFEETGLKIGKLVNKKQQAYGDSVSKASKLMRIFLEDYKNDNNTYTIPEELLDHILLQVRIIDKQNRIFSNPKGDLMEENPYSDTVGYGLLGMKMADKNNLI